MSAADDTFREWCMFYTFVPVLLLRTLVAASAMVSIQLELGVRATEQLELVPMDGRVRETCRNRDSEPWAFHPHSTDRRAAPGRLERSLPPFE